jgi:hypothetical protein
LLLAGLGLTTLLIIVASLFRGIRPNGLVRL